MNKFKTLLLAAAALAAVSSTAKADLVFATDAAPYPPFTSQNAAGEWEGWEYDLLQAMCAEKKEKCTLIPIAWDGIIPALLEKKMDGIFGSMSITDERKKQINFSDMYYNTASVIIGPKGADKTISAEAFKGKNIGVQASTTHANYAEKYYVPGGAVAKAYLDFLYSEEGQEIAAKHALRPRSASVLKKYAGTFKPLQLFTVQEIFGSLGEAQKVHFNDGGQFDKLYTAGAR